MTVRLRLTLIFATLLAAIGLLRSALVLSGFSNTLYTMARQDTATKALEVEDYLLDLDIELRKSGNTHGLALSSPEALPGAFSDDGSYLQLCDKAGNVLNRSNNLRKSSLPKPMTPGVETIELRLAHLPAGSRALLVTRPVILPEKGQIGWVQAAMPLTSDERRLSNLTDHEVISWIAAVLMAFAVGYFISGRALAPVSAMTNTVRGWGARDFDKRLPVGDSPNDEMGQLASTFNQLFERLQHSFEAQQRFVADASHELKSPLTAIRGHLQLLQRRGATHPAEASRWLDTALAEVDRLTRLVNDMLVLAATEPAPAATSGVELGGLVHDVVTQRQVLSPQVHPFAAEAEVWVLGDEDRLRQVLINLLDNAERATREQGEVQVGLKVEEGRALLNVKDSGVGMPQEAIARVFDRFYRVDAARDRQKGGTGLGLAIVAAIIEAHHGTIAVESEEGRGTTFNVSLPLA